MNDEEVTGKIGKYVFNVVSENPVKKSKMHIGRINYQQIRLFRFRILANGITRFSFNDFLIDFDCSGIALSN